MKTFDTSLMILETATLNTGLVAHEEIARFGDVKILEASTIGEGRFMILASGPEVALEAGLKAAREKLVGTQVVDQELIANVDRSILESIHSLSQQRLDGALVSIETETVAGAISLAQALVRHHGLAPIEVKIRRSGKGAHVYLTGAEQACLLAAEETRALMKKNERSGSVECFEKPSAALRSLFDFV